MPSVFCWNVQKEDLKALNRGNRIAERDRRKLKEPSIKPAQPQLKRRLFSDDSEAPYSLPSEAIEDSESPAELAEAPSESDCEITQIVCDPDECCEIIVGDSANSSNEEPVPSLSEEESEGLEEPEESPICVKVKAAYSASMFAADDEGIKFYTGLETYAKFQLVFSTLYPEADSIQYRYGHQITIKAEDAFLLTLMKLRRNTADYELGRFFGLPKGSVSTVFVTWINFLEQMWGLLDTWPSRELVDFYMPEGFKQEYPMTRVIVDATEFPASKPSQPAAQQATFSTYKNRNTLKVLVGSTPDGLLSFKSNAYGGATSDRQIVERCDLVQKCDEGDSVMADRGFTVQDLFATQGVTVNMPSFFKGKSQLKASVLLGDRKLASKRVHIERLIGLIKTYKILCTPLIPYYIPLGTKIFSVCFMLCNFRECIVSKLA